MIDFVYFFLISPINNKIYCQMQEIRCMQESQALKALLILQDISNEQFRYKHSPTESNEDQTQSYKKTTLSRIIGKQNMQIRKEELPKLNSSKQQLKQILRRLESTDPIKRIDQSINRVLQMNINLEHAQNHNCQIKSSRRDREKQQFRTVKKTKKDYSIRQISKDDEIRNLMKKKNYSSNALNLKTLNILQQLHSKNYRCPSTLSKEPMNESCKTNKRNLIAFLRKAA